MKLDLLAFGAHPDDIELSCGGALLVEKKNGKQTGIVDLTRGEMGTRGTAETRKQEAEDASKILGVSVRENLEMADGFFMNDKAHQLQIIQMIRKYQPSIIFCNAPSDRHPDHGRGANLVSDAAFLSGLQKVETTDGDQPQEAFRPTYVLKYIQDRYFQPNFVLDITSVFEEKLEAIRAYKTQFFQPGQDGPQTYISTPDFLDSIVYRAKMFGKMIGVKYAEGFISDKMIGISSLDALIKENT